MEMKENEIGTTLLEAAIHIHRELGPGLLEAVYEVILARELSDRGLMVQRQVPVPIVFKGLRFDEGFRADIIIEPQIAHLRPDEINKRDEFIALGEAAAHKRLAEIEALTQSL